MFPYLAYLLILAFQDMVPIAGLQVLIGVHIAITAWVCWLFRHHFPPMGNAHWIWAILVGLLAAWWWVAGQHWLDGLTVGGYGLGERLIIYPGQGKVYDPHVDFGHGSGFQVYALLKILRAVTVVPFVEELLWRGFLLRAFVNWNRYDEVPWGSFTWRALIGTALFSTVQHPDNWGVSIGCWVLFNLLFFWKKSLLCLMLTHAITNLVLYAYVLQTGDWRFW